MTHQVVDAFTAGFGQAGHFSVAVAGVGWCLRGIHLFVAGGFMARAYKNGRARHLERSGRVELSEREGVRPGDAASLARHLEGWIEQRRRDDAKILNHGLHGWARNGEGRGSFSHKGAQRSQRHEEPKTVER